MGKVEDLRALRQQMREAEQRMAPKPAGGGKVKRYVTEPRAVREVALPDLCGHRSISNKYCIRPAGHAEKNHRYAPAVKSS